MATMYEQCAEALRAVLQFYKRKGCPCAFPRFGQLVQFNFQDYGVGEGVGPVGCHATEMAIAMVTNKETGMYRKVREDGQDLTCTVCGSEIAAFWEQYNINLDVSRLQFKLVRAQAVGLSPMGEIPMPKGFFGFREEDMERCAERFSREGTFEQMAAYLMEVQQA